MPTAKTQSPTRWQIHHHTHVTSTNDLAIASTLAAWDARLPAHGILHIATSQSAGRGQHGRTWASPPGGLYLSAVVEQIPPDSRDRLALVAGVAVARALAEFGCSTVKIRWPNDLVIDEKKIAGILCESLARGENFATIIGIGVNVNTQMADMPERLQFRASSLAALFHKTFDPHAIAAAIGIHLAEAISLTQSTGLAWAIEAVRHRDALRGKKLLVTTDNSDLEGHAAGISDQGALLLDLTTHTQSISNGSIRKIEQTRIR